MKLLRTTQMPRSHPKVSILIPTFNQQEFIGACVTSALDQTYDQLEVIVSDDGSNDATAQIARRFLTDSRMRYERNLRTIGRVNNYRRLLYELASGDWILMLDGDDYLVNPTYVADAMELALSTPDVALVFGKVVQGPDVASSRMSSFDGEGLRPIMDGTDFFLKHPPFYDVMPLHLACLFRRDIALERNCYRHDILSTDVESFYRLMIGHSIGFVDKVAGLWRQHDRNMSKSPSCEACADNLLVFTGPKDYAHSLGISSDSELQRWLRKGAARYSLGCLFRMVSTARLLQALRFAARVFAFDAGILPYAAARVLRRMLGGYLFRTVTRPRPVSG